MEKKNSLLGVFLAIFIIATLALGGYVVYHKFFKVDTNKQDCPKCDTCNSTGDISCEKTGVSGEQILFSKIGIIYISSVGDVYFNPEKSATIYSVTYNVEEIAKKTFGNPNSLTVQSDKFFPTNSKEVFKYKLDLTNVRSVTEVELGNGGVNVTFIFIHNDGRVSELSFFDGGLEQMDGTRADLKLYKYVSGYSNIVSSVQDDDYSAHGAKLYDKCGNGIKYVSPRYKEN